MRGRARATVLAGGAFCAAFLLLGTGAASAQTLQRCESADGKVTYSNTACPPGTEPVRTVEGDPGPSAADQKAARERAQQRSRELDKLEKQRQKEEEKAARQRAAAEAREAKREAECRKLDARVRAARAELDAATLARRQALDRKLRAAEDQAAACRKN